MDIFYAVLAFLAVFGLLTLAGGIGAIAFILLELFEALTSDDGTRISIIGLAYSKNQVFKVEMNKDSGSESDED